VQVEIGLFHKRIVDAVDGLALHHVILPFHSAHYLCLLASDCGETLDARVCLVVCALATDGGVHLMMFSHFHHKSRARIVFRQNQYCCILLRPLIVVAILTSGEM
jgi:hypothetical protein